MPKAFMFLFILNGLFQMFVLFESPWPLGAYDAIVSLFSIHMAARAALRNFGGNTMVN